MKALAAQVCCKLRDDKPGPDFLAETLSTLPVESTPELGREAEILRELFHRKRNIVIQPHGTGYKISMLNGPYVISEDMREGLSQFLDTVAAMKAMEA